ncbi:Dicer-like protein 1 [Smittium mucronatum]|uniref:Dicer-like protein 1 n=1 Tax=Smittium mucronatum TaxID=133383 RepID=A0A1R0H3F0_9FUNG|nr:Dicer-like protein 1 [Smittium mucronatum]
MVTIDTSVSNNNDSINSNSNLNPAKDVTQLQGSVDSFLKHFHDEQTGDDRFIIDIDSLSKTLLPREYQKEALQKILDSNSILVLETGTGKTLVSSMLIEYTYRQYLNSSKLNSFTTINRPIFFLCNTSVLVEQQGEFLKKNSERTVKIYKSIGSYSAVSKNQWDDLWNDFQVHVMTGQLFLNILRTGYLEFSRVLLIIFDECHHSRKDEPYSRVMKEFYYHTEKEIRPQIFGMTASSSNAREDIDTSIRRIEAYLDSSMVSVDLSSNLESSNKLTTYTFLEYPLYYIEEKIPIYDMIVSNFISFEWFRQIISTLDFILNEIGIYPFQKLIFYLVIYLKNLVDPLKNIPEDPFLNPIGRISLDGGLSSITSFDSESCIKIEETYEHLENLEEFSETVRTIKNIQDSKNQIWLSHLNFTNSSSTKSSPTKRSKRHHPIKYFEIRSKLAPKVCIFMDYLLKNKNRFIQESSDTHEQFKAIVFIHRRSAVYSIAHLLNELEEFDFIRCKPFHGLNSKSNLLINSYNYSKNLKFGVSSSSQADVLSRFRSGEINVLISTQVSEEGLDISDCNLIIRFDPALTLTQFIQSRGRARKPKSEYVMMAIKNSIDKDFIHYSSYAGSTIRTRDMSVHRDSTSYKTFMAMEEVMINFCIAPKGIRYQYLNPILKSDKSSLITGKLTFNIGVEDQPFEKSKIEHKDYVETSMILNEIVKASLDEITGELFKISTFKNINEVFYNVTNTGAKLTALSSIGTINQYVQSIFCDKYAIKSAIFQIEEITKSQIRTTIIFPANSSVRKVVGPIYSNQTHSKRASCFYAVLVLFHYGLISEHLLPIKPKKLAISDFQDGSVLKMSYQEIHDMVDGKLINKVYFPYNQGSTKFIDHHIVERSENLAPKSSSEKSNYFTFLDFNPPEYQTPKLKFIKPDLIEDLEDPSYIDVYVYSCNFNYPVYNKSSVNDKYSFNSNSKETNSIDDRGLQLIFFFKNPLPDNVLIPLYTLKDSLPFYYSFDALNVSNKSTLSDSECEVSPLSPVETDGPSYKSLKNKVSLSRIEWESSVLFTSSLLTILTDSFLHLISEETVYAFAMPTENFSQSLFQYYKSVDIYSLTNSIFSSSMKYSPDIYEVSSNGINPKKEINVDFSTKFIDWSLMNKFCQYPDRLSNYPIEKYPEILNSHAFLSETSGYKLHKFSRVLDGNTAYNTVIEILNSVNRSIFNDFVSASENLNETEKVSTTPEVYPGDSLNSPCYEFKNEIHFLSNSSDEVKNIRLIDLLLQDSRLYIDYDYKNLSKLPLIESNEISLQFNYLLNSSLLCNFSDDKILPVSGENTGSPKNLDPNLPITVDDITIDPIGGIRSLIKYLIKRICVPDLIIILPWSLSDIYKLSVIPSLLYRLKNSLIQRDVARVFNFPINFDENNHNFFLSRKNSIEFKILKRNLDYLGKSIDDQRDCSVQTESDSDHQEVPSISDNFASRYNFNNISTESLTKNKNYIQKYIENYICYNSMPEWILRSALTSSSASEDVSYQRLETLGDSVLRLIVATQLFSGLAPVSSNEGVMSAYINLIVSNDTLSQLSVKSGICYSINSEKFERKKAPFIGSGFGVSRNKYPRFQSYYETPWSYDHKIPNPHITFSKSIPLNSKLPDDILSFVESNSYIESCLKDDQFSYNNVLGILSSQNYSNQLFNLDRVKFERYNFSPNFFTDIYSYVPYPSKFLYHKPDPENLDCDGFGFISSKKISKIDFIFMNAIKYSIENRIDLKYRTEIHMKKTKFSEDFVKRRCLIKDNSNLSNGNFKLSNLNQGDQSAQKSYLPKPIFFFCDPKFLDLKSSFQNCLNHPLEFLKIRKATKTVRELPLKTGADVIESILGSSFLVGGIKGSFKVAKTLGLVKKEWNSWDDMHPWLQKSIGLSFYSNFKSSSYYSDKPVIAKIEKMEEILDYKFANPSLLIEATTHSSLAISKSNSYERLEFLGDSVLSLLTTSHFFNYMNHYEPLSPRQITLLKHTAVSNNVLGIISQRHKLVQFLDFDNRTLEADFIQYNKNLETVLSLFKQFKANANSISTSEKSNRSHVDAFEGSLQASDWLDIPPKLWEIIEPPPKFMGDLVESLLGAVYVDSEFSLDTVRKVYNKLITPFIDRFISPGQVSIDPISQSNLTIQSHGCSSFKCISFKINEPIKDSVYNDSILSIVIREHILNNKDFSLLNQDYLIRNGFNKKELKRTPYSFETKEKLKNFTSNIFDVKTFDQKIDVKSLLKIGDEKIKEILFTYMDFNISYYVIHGDIILGSGIGAKMKSANNNACSNFLQNWNSKTSAILKELFNQTCDCSSKRTTL